MLIPLKNFDDASHSSQLGFHNMRENYNAQTPGRVYIQRNNKEMISYLSTIILTFRESLT